MNPLGTEEQRDIESLALRLLETDAVQQARRGVEQRWRMIVGPENLTAEAEARLGEMVDEFSFNYLLKAAAGDPNHPRIAGMLWSPPHEWLGISVPGSRTGGGECPDNHYAVIPVEYGARYRIRGRRFDPEPADAPLLVSGNPMLTMTLGAKDLSAIDVAADGSFELTLGPDPQGDDPNHVHVAPGAMYLFFRWSRSDWRQVPDALEVERIDPPRSDPWSEEQTAARAAAMMLEDVPPTYWWLRVLDASPLNVVPEPTSTGGAGGLADQSTAFSRLELGEDDALVLGFEAGGAGYWSVVLYDCWFRTIEYWRRQTSLNPAQSVPNPDGTFSFVVAHEDPGVANWLDAAGLQRLLMIQRWQRVPAGLDAGGPSTASTLVKLSELDSALLADVPRFGAGERRAALDERAAEFRLRYRGD